MAQQIDKNNLGYLGEDFQYKLAKFFVEDHEFFEALYPIIDQNSFTDIVLKKFVTELKNYYKKENVVPSYGVMSMKLNSCATNEFELEEYKALIQKLQNEVTFEGVNLVKENALKFFKQQNLVRVANKILDIAGKGDIDRYDECEELWDNARLIGQDNDLGFSLFDLEDKALSPDYKVKIPTGVSKLDAAMKGGIDKKKLGVIIGSAGFGKSTLSTAIASYAATYKCQANNYNGFKVLQIYFEDEDVDITKKHFSRITQVEAMNIGSQGSDIDEIRRVLATYPDREMLAKNLRLKSFRTGTKTASDVELFLKRLINSGFKPDLVILDYFECLIPEKGGYQNDSEWSREGKTMRKLENIAKDYDIAMWVPTQGNKGSITSSELVTMDQAGGSIKKVQIGHVIVSIARSIEDQDNNLATLAVLKNRMGKSGLVWNKIKFNNGTSTISCDEVVEIEGQYAYHDEVERIKEKNRIEQIRKLQDKINSSEDVDL